MQNSVLVQLLQRKLEIEKIVESMGISIEFGSDFRIFSSVPLSQPKRSQVNSPFDPSKSSLNAGNALWMICRNTYGEIVLTQAIKLLDLNNTNLAEHFSKKLWHYCPIGFDLDRENTRYHLTSSASKITGKVTYHGDLWCLGGPRGIRGGCLTSLLTRLLMLKSMVQWNPDFMIGLQIPMIACKGLGAREGYLRMEQGSVFWPHINDSATIEAWLVWMDNEEALFNLRTPPKLFQELFEIAKPPKSSSLEEIKKSA